MWNLVAGGNMNKIFVFVGWAQKLNGFVCFKHSNGISVMTGKVGVKLK